MSSYSTKFAQYYDSLMSQDAVVANTIQKLLRKYQPHDGKIKLLELACGTGTILQQMPKAYDLFGLDIAESMLAIAKQKVPQATFIQADMSNFILPHKFDIIICLFDSINHLTTWKQWENTFRLAHRHLSPHGIFIFDMNTMRRMALLSTFKPHTEKLDNKTVVFVKVNPPNKNIYRGQFVIIENVTSKTPLVTEELVDEAVFPVEKVKSTLEKYFYVEKMVDPIRKRVSSQTGRVFFICKNK